MTFFPVHMALTRACLWALGVVCILTAQPLKAQVRQGPVEDVVYLHNGSIIRGVLVGQQPGIAVQIRTADGTVLTFPSREIALIRVEPALYRRIKLPALAQQELTSPSPCIYRYAGLGFGFARGVQPGAYLDAGLGVRIHHLLQAGVGVGIHDYDQVMFCPLRAELRSELGRGYLCPFISLAGGYGFPLLSSPNYEQFRGGPSWQAAAGIRIQSTPRQSWVFSVGFGQQQSQQTYFLNPPWWQIPQPDPIFISGSRTYNRIMYALTLQL